MVLFWHKKTFTSCASTGWVSSHSVLAGGAFCRVSGWVSVACAVSLGMLLAGFCSQVGLLTGMCRQARLLVGLHSQAGPLLGSLVGCECRLVLVGHFH